MSTILVTGAAGFIGSNLCHYLVRQGHHAVGLDAMKTGSSYSNLEGIDLEMFTLAELDLCCDGSLECLEGYHFDAIYHLAAESHVDRSIDGDLPFWQTNVVGTSNLLRWAASKGVPRILNQITDEVYGPKDTGESMEGDPLLPTSPYAASKAAQYLVGMSYINTYKAPIIHTFPANTYGPRQYTEKLIPKFTKNLLTGQQVPLMKSSHFVRDWLPVCDHVSALVTILNNGNLGEGYNVPGGWVIPNLEVTQELLALTDRDESAILEVPDRKSHDSRYCVNGQKVLDLGWHVTRDFSSYLAETVEWYRERYGL